MTGQDIFNMAIDFMCKRDVAGTIEPNKVERYKVRTPSILTAWQSTVARIGNLYKTYSFACKPFENKLNDSTEVIRYEGTDKTYEYDGVCYAYSVTVDVEGNTGNSGIIYIEDYTTVWNTLATISLTTATTATNYKGVVTPTASATKSRIRLSSDTGSGDNCTYLAYNMAMFDVKMQSGQVPEYAPYIKYSMPSDFKSIDQVIDISADNYTEGTYRWENTKDLYVSKDYEGVIRIVYRPIPTTITALTSTIEVDAQLAVSGAYYLATHLLLVEEPTMSSYFEQKYNELISLELRPKPARTIKITDVY
jgi:hypothetical protein